MPKPNVIELFALGTKWWITFSSLHELSVAKGAVLEQIATFEATYSRFRETSLLSQLNQQKYIKNAPQEFIDILQECLDLYENSEGIFNISVGSALEQMGYGNVSDSSARISDNLRKDVIITGMSITLSPHTRIDLGGIGKGWLIDAVADRLRVLAPSGFIINGGGDIYIHAAHPTQLALEHPFEADQYIGTIRMTHGSLAVSSPHKRIWIKKGVRNTHIINPGRDKKTRYTSSYVQAPNALAADTLATILLIASDRERVRIVSHYPVEYLLLNEDFTYIASSGFHAEMNV